MLCVTSIARHNCFGFSFTLCPVKHLYRGEEASENLMKLKGRVCSLMNSYFWQRIMLSRCSVSKQIQKWRFDSPWISINFRVLTHQAIHLWPLLLRFAAAGTGTWPQLRVFTYEECVCEGFLRTPLMTNWLSIWYSQSAFWIQEFKNLFFVWLKKVSTYYLKVFIKHLLK